jgi:putative ABC transport system permease protein
MSLVVRTAVDPGSLIPAIRSAVQSIDPQQPVHNVNTMEERVRRSVSTRRMITFLLVAFAAVALMLAAIGIYGVISYSIIQRTQEIGIRMALGAQTGDVLKLIVGQGMMLTLTGVGFGTLAALALNRFISSMVFGISTTDLTTLASVSVLLVAVALIACYVPARRATHISPMMALKYE